MEVLDEVKNWAAKCARCGTCKYFYDLYLPSCPPGERFRLEGYYPSGDCGLEKACKTGY